MRLARQMLRKQQIQEIKNSWCQKCGSKLIVRKGQVFCEKCEASYGKVRDRI